MKRTFTSLMKNNPDDYVYDENHLNGIVFRMIEQNLFPPFKKSGGSKTFFIEYINTILTAFPCTPPSNFVFFTK